MKFKHLPFKPLLLPTLLCASSFPALAQDQCNFTSQCRNQYGNTATDCRDSRSNNSVCMCGNTRCDSGLPAPTPAPSPTPTPSGGNVDDVVVELESFSRTGKDGAAVAGDTVVGFNRMADGINFNTKGDHANYNVSFPAPGTYRVSLTAGSPVQGQIGAQLIFNNNVVSSAYLSATGGWGNYVNFDLNGNVVINSAGTYNMRLKSIGSAPWQWNGDKLTFEFVSGNSPTPAPTPAPTPTPSNGGNLGMFDKDYDLLLANFDSKPDPDDIHSVAGLATMLRDSRFNGVKYHAVSGAYGTQGGRYIVANRLFNMAFGANNWSNAHANRNNALNQVYNKVSQTLRGGGDIWVQEAGQSDFTADLVRRIKQQMPNVNTRDRIHVIQHSNWNQDKTTPGDLTYVRNNTDYRKIADGNSTNNGTPGFNTRNGGNWGRATNDPQVGAIWREARAVANHEIATTPGWKNPNIQAGGMDFSDVVEDTWIFGFNNLRNVGAFFDEFL